MYRIIIVIIIIIIKIIIIIIIIIIITQSTALEQKRFDLRLLSSALRNLWLLLVYWSIYSLLLLSFVAKVISHYW